MPVGDAGMRKQATVPVGKSPVSIRSLPQGAITSLTRWTSGREMARLFSSQKLSSYRGCAVAYCPECEAKIEVDNDVEEGQTLDCPECGAALEVVNTNPVELDIIEHEDEEEDSW